MKLPESGLMYNYLYMKEGYNNSKPIKTPTSEYSNLNKPRR